MKIIEGGVCAAQGFTVAVSRKAAQMTIRQSFSVRASAPLLRPIR